MSGGQPGNLGTYITRVQVDDEWVRWSWSTNGVVDQDLARGCLARAFWTHDKDARGSDSVMTCLIVRVGSSATIGAMGPYAHLVEKQVGIGVRSQRGFF